ncbi:MAG: hypothetical protein KatS3mg025_0290 [Bacteroidia bacterium]|nr:MAG: hypothetical protein KatS3mg025_0290 [Bacteroidia bacterium]
MQVRRALIGAILSGAYLWAQCNFNMTNGQTVHLGTTSCCGGASFYDDGGPSGNYSNSQNSLMRFVAPNGQRIQISFSSFTLENADYLELYDGSGTGAPLIGRYGGTNTPPAVVSLSDTVTFRFYSDGTVNYAGWAATLSCVSVNTPDRYVLGPGQVSWNIDCARGIVFTDDGGTEGSYSAGVDDTVTFVPASGQYAWIAFPYQLSLGAGDTLWIWEGSPAPANLLAMYVAGSNRGDTVVAGQAGTSLIVRFKSDAITQAAGFQGHVGCGALRPAATQMGLGVRRISCTSGWVLRFYDDGGPGANYANTQNRLLRVVAPNGQRVQISFSSFTLENADYLELYDGSGTGAPLIGRYGGTNTPPAVVSLSDTVTFRFYSDGTVNYAGWAATLSCVSVNTPDRYVLGPGQVSWNIDCARGIVFTDDGGTEGSYSAGVDDTVTFVPASGQYAWIAFPYQLSLGAGDTVWIWEKSMMPDHLLAVFTPGNSARDTVSASLAGEPLIFRFKSDGITEAVGWQAYVGCAPTPRTGATCMGTGYRYLVCQPNWTYRFYDTGGPTASYVNSENRQMYFVLRDGATACGGISFSFSSFSTEACCDSMRIYNGGTPGTSTYWTLRGSSASPNPINGSADTMLVVFRSDGTTPSSGWIAQLSCVQSGPTVTISPSSATLCPGGTVTLTASGAASYTWNTGATGSTLVVSQAGTYYVIGATANGCQAASAPVTVVADVIDTTVQVTGTQLSVATPQAGFQYSWINCEPPIAVVGTGTSYTATATGWYALIAHNPNTGCQDTSNCHYVDVGTTGIGSSEGNIHAPVRLYPNPSKGYARVESAVSIEWLRVWDAQGRLVQEVRVGGRSAKVEALETGVYWVEVGLAGGERWGVRWLVVR